MNINIRQENESDYDKVFSLVQAAFATTEHSDGDEQNLVTRLRKSEAFVPELSLVAEVNDEIVGHILFTKIRIGESDILALGLAPLAVLPELQKHGIGGKLIEAGHKIAKELGYVYSIVLGHEEYYPRFGYKPASVYGIKPPFPVNDENFMAIKLVEDEKATISGTVSYAKEFFEK